RQSVVFRGGWGEGGGVRKQTFVPRAFASFARAPCNLKVNQWLRFALLFPRVAVETQCFASGLSALARGPEDQRRAGEADRGPGDVPLVRPLPLDPPEPEERGRYVDTAIGGIGATGEDRRALRQKPGEDRQRRHSGKEPERGPVEPQPGPKGEAAGDLGQGRGGIDRHALHRFARVAAPPLTPPI